MFGFAENSGTWVHVLGFALCCSACYKLWAGWSGNKAFARLTVHTRPAPPVLMLALMMMGKVDTWSCSSGSWMRLVGCGRG